MRYRLIPVDLMAVISLSAESWPNAIRQAINTLIGAANATMSVLMACLMAFGQLSADNEITAIKSTGISL
ncbi:MAG: LptF/LptG family permease, partial [bacterium]|nr:LptF/LptG family permease [bacterium]